VATNGVDPSAKTPARIRRNWARTTKGAGTASINVVQPVSINGLGQLVLNVATVSGLLTTASALSIKLDSTPGLVLASTGIKVLLDPSAPGLQLTSGLKILLPSSSGLQLAVGGLSLLLDTTPGLQLGVSGLSAKLSATGALSVSASGLAVTPDGTTIEISGNAIRVKDGAITGAKFGWGVAKGDILVYDGTTYQRLPVGTNGQVLTADSTAATGLKWV
jgi:hypothetical protein